MSNKSGKRVVVHHTLKDIAKRVKSVAVKAGVLSTAPNYPDGTLIVDVAKWNEFGTEDSGGHTPQRSFIYSTIMKNKRKYDKLIQAAVLKAIENKTATATKEFIVLGNTAKKDIETALVKGGEPFTDNAQSTQRAKGNKGGSGGAGAINHPLINSSHLLSNIDWGYADNE